MAGIATIELRVLDAEEAQALVAAAVLMDKTLQESGYRYLPQLSIAYHALHTALVDLAAYVAQLPVSVEG